MAVNEETTISSCLSMSMILPSWEQMGRAKSSASFLLVGQGIPVPCSFHCDILFVVEFAQQIDIYSSRPDVFPALALSSHKSEQTFARSHSSHSTDNDSDAHCIGQLCRKAS